MYSLSAVSDAVASIKVERMAFTGCQGCSYGYASDAGTGEGTNALGFSELTTVTMVLRYARDMRLVRGCGLPAKA